MIIIIKMTLDDSKFWYNVKMVMHAYYSSSFYRFFRFSISCRAKSGDQVSPLVSEPFGQPFGQGPLIK